MSRLFQGLGVSPGVAIGRAFLLHCDALPVVPYPIPPEHAEAWMVQQLRPGVIGRASGTVRCADMLDKPEHWRE